MKKLIYLCFIIIIFLIQNVFAIGIGSIDNNVIFFQPNIEKSFYFTLRGVAVGTRAELYIEGELKDYVTLSEVSEDGVFVATVRLPEEIEEPGVHKVFINAEEVPISSKGTLSAVTAVAVPIKIIVPYPGKYIEASLEAPDINIGDTAGFIVSVTNLGEEEIGSVKGYISIYGPDGQEIESIETQEKSLAINTIENLYADWQTTGKKEGLYTAVASVFYDGATIETERRFFKIGALVIKIIGLVSEKFEEGKVNPFVMELKSEWANKIQDVHADVKILKNRIQIDSFETPSIEMQAFERKEITAYWNTKGIDAGNYTAAVTLHYSDKKIEETFKIQVEKPEKTERKFSWYSIIYALIVVLIVLVYYLKKSKKRKNK